MNGSVTPLALQKAKGDHVWKDMVRQCEKYQLAWTRPWKFARTALLPLRVAPMFFVGDDMFWGNDRLDDALTHCTRERA